jgi:DNA-binding beta-propeller fold protein YncE
MLRTLFLAFLFGINSVASAAIFDFFESDSLADGSRYAFIPSGSSAQIIAIDTRSNEVAGLLDLPHLAGKLVVSEKLDLLVATSLENNSATIVSLDSREVVTTLDLGMRPDTAVLNPFDRYIAFGSSDGVVSVWDLQAVEEVFTLEGLGSAHNLTYGFDGRNLYVVDGPGKRVSVIEMREQKRIAEIDLGGPPGSGTTVSALSRSADGYTGFVSVTSEDRVVVIDLIDWHVKNSIKVGSGPLRPYSTADNRYVLVPLRDDESLAVLSALSHELVATVPTGIRARELNSGWLDTVAFLMPETGNLISAVDLESLSPAGMIELPGPTDDGLVTSDSKMMFASIINSGEVAAIDTRFRKLVDIIETPVDRLQGIEIGISNNICH